jgi:hypothetical protein
MDTVLDNDRFVADVAAAADLPFRLTVWIVLDQLWVTAPDGTVLASMPIARAAILRCKAAAGALGREARAAYDGGVRSAQSA